MPSRAAASPIDSTPMLRLSTVGLELAVAGGAGGLAFGGSMNASRSSTDSFHDPQTTA